MKTGLSLLLLLFTASGAFAQTKLLFHKSHSGSAALFAYTAPGYNSNFGILYEPEVHFSHLEKVVFINDTTALMYTSGTPEPGKEHLWQPGCDTVYNHPLFTRQHALDSIKEVLDNEYQFVEPADSVQFIGFDNTGAKRIVSPEQKQPDSTQKKELYLLLVFIVSTLVFGWVGPAVLRKRKLVSGK